MKTARKLLVAGHRGAHGLAADNTLAGYKTALDHHVDIIETDSRLTKDGIVVQFHDRATYVPGKGKINVSSLTFQDLKDLHPNLTTLEQTINFVGQRACLMLEIKDLEAVAPTAQIIDGFMAKGWQSENFMLASFNYQALNQLKNLLPLIPLVVLENKAPIRAMWRAKRLHTNYLSINQHNLWWGAVWLLSKGYNVFCYPPPRKFFIDHKKPLSWHKFGLHGAITDFPDYYAPEPAATIEL